MALVRDLGITLPAFTPTVLVSCSAIISTGSTTPAPTATTADALITTGGASPLTTGFGRAIDRTAPPLGTLYNVAMPSALLESTVGSTEANRQVTIGVKLQHGDSSGGGDAVDYSTANQPADRVYFGTGRTTDMLNWDSTVSSGPLRATSNPAYYDLRGAKKYIRIAVRFGLNQRTATTESTGEERARVSGAITFIGAADLPQVLDPKSSPFSTSTSTA